MSQHVIPSQRIPFTPFQTILGAILPSAAPSDLYLKVSDSSKPQRQHWTDVLITVTNIKTLSYVNTFQQAKYLVS